MDVVQKYLLNEFGGFILCSKLGYCALSTLFRIARTAIYNGRFS